MTVSSSFLAKPTTEHTTSLSWIDVRFWAGADPARSANDAYGEAEWECLTSGSDRETETCTATFTPDDSSEVKDFFWTLDGVSFGAWPSQTSSVAAGYHWVKVSSVTATGAATGKPFTVKGHVRARYAFDFEPDPSYSYGDIGLRFVEDGGCERAKHAAERRVNEQKGVLHLGFMAGKYCGSVYMPGPISGRGTVKVTFEELRPE